MSLATLLSSGLLKLAQPNSTAWIGMPSRSATLRASSAAAWEMFQTPDSMPSNPAAFQLLSVASFGEPISAFLSVVLNGAACSWLAASSPTPAAAEAAKKSRR